MQFDLLLTFTVLLRGSLTLPLDTTTPPPTPNVVLFDPSTLQGIGYDELIESETKHEKLVTKLQKLSVGVPNAAVGRLIDAWTPGLKNPEELSFYLHGDLLQPISANSRNGLENVTYRWPSGKVYYRIADSFGDAERTTILSAISEYHKSTCIRFEPYSGVERDYVSIERGNTGCWSSVGRIGGKQIVNLQSPGCLYYIGTPIHELLHTIGFFHEQSRLDRDAFVKIEFGNIIKGQGYNFVKENSVTYNIAYDYGSVMHYSKYAFSRNNRATIETKTQGVEIGQRRGLSPSDIQKIRLMYRCVGDVSSL